jgi:hypothetical protein
MRCWSADPFQAVELPEIIEEYLEHGTTTSVAFNRRGTLLAGACLCGAWIAVPLMRSCACVALLGALPLLNHCPIAAGTAEGTIVVWDFDTKGVAKTYTGHT